MLGSIRAAAPLVAALCSATAAAQDGGDRDDQAALDRTPQSCITASRIDSTEVIDDSTIVFHMRGRDEAYVNSLPRRCPNLAREDRFTYTLRSQQLCDVTTITVLEDTGFAPGFTCRLGEFHPVTAAEVEELRRVAEGAGSGDAVEVEEVELPDDDGADEPDDEAADEDSEARGENDERNDREDDG